MYKIVLAFATFFPAFSFGQVSEYLPDGATWRINRVGLSGSNQCWYNDQLVCTVAGDSVIGPYTYKKIMERGYYQEFGIVMGTQCAPSFVHNNLYALLRQDSLSIYLWDGNQDTLLYDYNLQVGDTLPLSFNNVSTEVVVDSISEIQIGNDMRKVFHLGNNPEVDKLIEGVGHNKGLVGSMQPFEFFENELRCFALNDTVRYPYLDAPCDFDVSLNELSEEVPGVFPNPTNANWQIKIPAGTEIKEVIIRNYAGQEQPVSLQFSGSDSFEADAHNLPAGVYLLELRTKTGERMHARLIKAD